MSANEVKLRSIGTSLRNIPGRITDLSLDIDDYDVLHQPDELRNWVGEVIDEIIAKVSGDLYGERQQPPKEE